MSELESLETNMRYNEETDTVQIYFNDQWSDWAFGGLINIDFLKEDVNNWVITTVSGTSSGAANISYISSSGNLRFYTGSTSTDTSTAFTFIRSFRVNGTKILYYTFTMEAGLGSSTSDYNKNNSCFYIQISTDGETWSNVTDSIGCEVLNTAKTFNGDLNLFAYSGQEIYIRVLGKSPAHNTGPQGYFSRFKIV